jgi:hypothetical protein
VQRGAAYLDEVLALGLGHERLQLGCGECVHQARLGHDEEQHLGAGEDGQLVCLACRVSSERGAVVFLMRRDGSARAAMDADAVRRARNEWLRTFFMMPALRLEKVMCRRDLSTMNLISILRRSRPGLSSSSSSSSAAGRWRLVPRASPTLRVPLPSSCSEGDACWSWSVISEAMVVVVVLMGGGDAGCGPNCLRWLWGGCS